MTEDKKPPNEELAEKIAKSLVGEGLISKEYQSALESKLKSSGVTESDWHAWVKNAIMPQKSEDDSDE